MNSLLTTEAFARLEGYQGMLVKEIAALTRHCGVQLEIVTRSDSLKGFKVLSMRWSVERNFAWLVRNRQHVRNYEVCPEHSIALVQLSMIKLMLARIARQAIFQTRS
jgi:hypothetical protein